MISLTQVAMLLNICNAFKEIPQLPKNMQDVINKGKPITSSVTAANNVGVKEQKRARAMREEDFL